jgi:hypothetical protein
MALAELGLLALFPCHFHQQWCSPWYSFHYQFRSSSPSYYLPSHFFGKQERDEPGRLFASGPLRRAPRPNRTRLSSNTRPQWSEATSP